MVRDGITAEQYEQLLQPLPVTRVAKRKQAGMELSYLEAWDVKAHLIRIFGFGGWSWHVSTAELAFEDNSSGKWNIGYKVIGTLTIHALCADYTEAAVGSSTQGSRGEAHDMAVKTAESDALKRAAINLGTQFGLSLYNDGSRKDVVGHTLVMPSGYTPTPVSEPVVITVDFIIPIVDDIRDAMNQESLKEIWDMCDEAHALDARTPEGETLRNLIVARLNEIKADA